MSGFEKPSRGRRLCPRRRTVDRATMRTDWDYLWKLALRRKVAGNVPAIGGVEAEVRRALAWIEHDCPSFEFVSHKVEWRDEVRIAGENDKCVSRVCVGVAEKRCREVDVCPLLLHLYHMHKAVCGCWTMLASEIYGRNPGLVLVVVALDDIHATMRNDGLKIDVLTFNRRGVVRICLGPGDKVLYCYKLMTCAKLGMSKHGADKRGYVKPFTGWTPAQQPVVEIAAVNVCYGSHFVAMKKIGPQALRPKTLFRVGRALRLDMNPLTDSARIVPNSAAKRKGARRRMPEGALMSGFEKPPRGRRLCPRRRTVDRAAVGNVKMWNCGNVKVWKYENGLGLRQIE